MGKLTIRAYVGQRLDGLTEDMLDNYKILKEKYPLEDDWIRFGFLKGHIDGTLGSGTALFFEPFEDEPDKSGLPFQSYEELERIIVAADKMGFQIAIHAIGSLGNNLSLNAIEKAQELTMEEAIELYTLGSAYSEFMEERKGIIKKGYLGDVVIFDRDLLTIPFDQIMSTKVDYTIVGGKVIYQKTGKQ